MTQRILIVEDEPDNLTLIVHILSFLLKQEDLVTATDGLEAIRVAYDAHPDLILMDLSLPKLTGWEATRSLRVSPQFERTPILALTAHAMVGDKEKALDAGCNGYFSKPIDIDQFILFIQPYLVDGKLSEADPVKVAQPVAAMGEAAVKTAPPSDTPLGGPDAVNVKQEVRAVDPLSVEGATRTERISQPSTQPETSKTPLPGLPAASPDSVEIKQEVPAAAPVSDGGTTKMEQIDRTKV